MAYLILQNAYLILFNFSVSEVFKENEQVWGYTQTHTHTRTHTHTHTRTHTHTHTHTTCKIRYGLASHLLNKNRVFAKATY